MGATFSQKVLAAKSGARTVAVGEIVEAEPDFVLTHDNTAAIVGTFRKMGGRKIKDPSRAVVVLDHAVPAPSEKYALNHKEIREFVREQGISSFYDCGRGICHQVLPEEGFARPGSLILGSDSHTTTYGALGAFATGIGRSEAAAVWALGKLWLRVPETCRIVVEGTLPPMVSAKDVVLHLLGRLGADGALYKAVEYGGGVVSAMSVDSRMVLCNMAVEMGAKVGYIEADTRTFQWLGEPPSEVPRSDPDASFESVIPCDVSELEPQVSCPHSVDNVKPVSEVQGEPVHQVLVGTCTNGRLEDFRLALRVIEGRKLHPGVRMLVFPASSRVLRAMLREGMVERLVEFGAMVMNPGCGPCLGAHEGILAPGETCISTANRNFKGRMGCPDSSVYLASPATAAASAITGYITDPREVMNSSRQ
jgi:3-isopropylmalate/(R)-2-methylmalate dehydratase large subunit